MEMLAVIQGEHKAFPWLQIFITRKLRGIQTFFLNVTQDFFLQTNLSNGKKNMFVFHVVFL
jgi:hypothetical protein